MRRRNGANHQQYARVSTLIRIWKFSSNGSMPKVVRSAGASRQDRTELATIVEFLQEGDELIVTRLDRQGRDVLNIAHECEQRGTHVAVLEPQVSNKSEVGKIILIVPGMAGQMEFRGLQTKYPLARRHHA
ncbi:recombinase family protein [Rhizobium sp. AN70]|uniref:recombinase family protein n=2 Tax=unclassified Rhizobium TaxID=2613769 RepID=UPI0032B017D0